MGNGQSRFVYCLDSEHYDIKIQGTWSPPFASHPTLGALDRMQCVEQLARREFRFQRDHLIEIPVLGEIPQRRGFLDGRCAKEAAQRKRRERAAGAREIAGTVAQIGAKRDVSDLPQRLNVQWALIN